MYLLHPVTCSNGIDDQQLMFSRDGWSLFVGCRKSNEILAWDLRCVVDEVLHIFICFIYLTITFFFQPYLRLNRDGDTNQRIGFDMDWSGRYLISGSKVWAFVYFVAHDITFT